jgi:hypothetical protein
MNEYLFLTKKNKYKVNKVKKCYHDSMTLHKLIMTLYLSVGVAEYILSKKNWMFTF